MVGKPCARSMTSRDRIIGKVRHHDFDVAIILKAIFLKLPNTKQAKNSHVHIGRSYELSFLFKPVTAINNLLSNY